MFFKRLLNLFSNELFIEVNQDYFIIKTDEKTINLQTYLYVVKDSNKVLAIGEEPIYNKYNHEEAKRSNETIRVELFKKTNNANNIDKIALLENFFRYGLDKIPNKTTLVRPTVYIFNVDSLDNILCGHQRFIFNQALTNLGAHKVIFK
jgi:hypothetical protein